MKMNKIFIQIKNRERKNENLKKEHFQTFLHVIMYCSLSVVGAAMKKITIEN